MGKADPPGGIFLDAVDEALAVDVRRDAVEDQVSGRIRVEVQLAVAVEIGDLKVDVVDRFLIGGHVELVELVLMFVEEGRIEIGYPKSREVRRLPGIVGNLIGPVRYAAHEGEAAGRIDRGRQIEKSLLLRRAVVNGFIRGNRIFYSQIASKIAPGNEILGLSDGSAIFERRRDGAVAGAVDANAAGVC